MVCTLGLVEVPAGRALRKSSGPDWHAGGAESSTTPASPPQLAYQDQAKSESGSLGGQNLPQNVCTGRGMHASRITIPEWFFDHP